MQVYSHIHVVWYVGFRANVAAMVLPLCVTNSGKWGHRMFHVCHNEPRRSRQVEGFTEISVFFFLHRKYDFCAFFFGIRVKNLAVHVVAT